MIETSNFTQKQFADFIISVWTADWSCGDGCCSESYSVGRVTQEGVTIISDDQSYLSTADLMVRLEHDLVDYIKENARVEPSESFKQQCIRAYEVNQNMTVAYARLRQITYKLYRAFAGYSKYTKQQQSIMAEIERSGLDRDQQFDSVLVRE